MNNLVSMHVRQSGALSPATLDEIRFALARALWNAKSATQLDHRRAREQAKPATFKHGERAVQRGVERDAWLAAPARSKAAPH